MRKHEHQTSRLEKMSNFFGGNHFSKRNPHTNSEAEVLSEEELYCQLLKTEDRLTFSDAGNCHPVTDYIGLVRELTWQQKWDAAAGTMREPHDVTGRVWSDAVERCLAENGSAYIPRMAEPVYIDRPMVLRSGNRLVIHPETEIRLIVGARGTCMIYNFRAES